MRWSYGGNGTAEPGSGNVGTDFVVQRYSDTGGFIDQPLVITRSNGRVTMGQSMLVMGNVGFNGNGPIAKPTVSGACAGNTAIKALLTALANYGLVTDSPSA